MTIAFVFQLL